MTSRRVATASTQHLLFLAASSALFIAAPVFAHGGIDDGDGDPNAPLENAPGNPDGHVLAHGNVGLAFGLTALAAAACILGSTLPFLDILLARVFGMKDFDFTRSKPFLASSISFAAGVLLYLSLGDLFPEAIGNWASSFKPKTTQRKAAGIIAVAILTGTVLLIFLSKRLARHWRATRNNPEEAANSNADLNRIGGCRCCGSKDCFCDVTVAGNIPLPNGECACLKTPVAKKADSDTCCEVPSTEMTERDLESNEHRSGAPQVVHDPHFGEVRRPVNSTEFRRLGLQIAGALLVHNFPEGLATFATTLASARIGTMFGIALALHKIPEGVMISLPIYVATGSRWKGFLVSAVIGTISQFLGALLGYLLFVTYWNSAISGSIFAIVTGVLLYTVIGNMLPLARSFDTEDRYVTIWVFIGIIFFATVASLFSFA
ncbi:Zinc/iron permease [Syncephalis fuscata]|nr:Zinc/iron permease [Syncephalis fuscata]